jgi:catechol 2,3-dioxygenase-like lactoylglutathione lyase family enzyme
MKRTLAHIALVVRDYDEAIRYYVDVLKFQLLEDTVMSETKRWVIVAPNDHEGCNLLLAKAANEEQLSRVGNQTGGRVFLFLHTDDFQGDYDHLIAHGVEFIRGPVDEPYGRVGVFKDLYGNLWDLIEPKEIEVYETPYIP